MNCERENLRISYTSECFINFSFVYLGLSTRGDFRGKYINYPMETSLSAKLLSSCNFIMTIRWSLDTNFESPNTRSSSLFTFLETFKMWVELGVIKTMFHLIRNETLQSSSETLALAKKFCY